ITAGLMAMGKIHLEHKNAPLATNMFEMALELNKKSGNKEAVANIMFNMGKVSVLSKKPVQAKKYFLESLEIRKNKKDSVGIGFCLNELARLEIADYSFMASARYADQAQAIAKNVDNYDLSVDNCKVYIDAYWRQSKFKNHTHWVKEL